ncbi:unnamed protein product [Ascophyllum nodosum]
MKKSWAIGGVLALSSVLYARSACDDVDLYFGNVSSVSEISLDVIRIDCPALTDGEELEEIVIESGTNLTITTTRDYVRFVNVRFTVEEDASLTFDLPKTLFGPNSGSGGDDESGYIIDVEEGGTVTFTGKARASKADNVRSVFNNEGVIEFQGDALFNNNGNVFRSNYGTIKFRGDTVFKNNNFLAVDNQGADAYVRFSKEAYFEDNAGAFDGGDGLAISNEEGTASFHGEAYFVDHDGTDGGAVYNGGKMRFYDKVKFYNNTVSEEWGGGCRNANGTLEFKAAVQFIGNVADVGGGLAVTGGDVTFHKGVLFEENGAYTNGGAFSLTLGDQFTDDDETDDVVPGSLTFSKPEAVSYTDNYIADSEDDDELVTGCTLAYVEDGTTLIGFDVEDICMEDTV